MILVCERIAYVRRYGSAFAYIHGSGTKLNARLRSRFAKCRPLIKSRSAHVCYPLCGDNVVFSTQIPDDVLFKFYRIMIFAYERIAYARRYGSAFAYIHGSGTKLNARLCSRFAKCRPLIKSRSAHVCYPLCICRYSFIKRHLMWRVSRQLCFLQEWVCTVTGCS